MIEFGDPVYFITANLNYNMLIDRTRNIRDVNKNASFIVCDGMPMVWHSKLNKRPLPKRIAGSELIYALNKWAAAKGHRVYFLGGAPGVAQAAADKLMKRYPDLQVAGGVVQAPMWIQKCGMELFYRLAQEPQRLVGRYWRNRLFLLKAIMKDIFIRQSVSKAKPDQNQAASDESTLQSLSHRR